MNDGSEPRLVTMANALIALAVLLVLAGVAIAIIASRNLAAIGSGLLVDADSVRRMLGSFQRIGAIALPLIAIAIGGCGISIRRTLRRNQDGAEHGVAPYRR